MASPRIQARSPGFTLVELMIVVAIIAVLAAVLLPSIGGAREGGRMVVCSSNLRQLQMANDVYANDSKDRCCPGAPDFLANLTRWHGARASASAAFAPGGGTLTPYLADDGAAQSASRAVRSCPTFAPTLAALASIGGAGFERSAGGYGYNNAFVGVERARSGRGRGDNGRGAVLWSIITDRLGSARSRFAAPVMTAVFADAALADGAGPAGVIEYSFIEPRFWPDSDPPARPDPSIHFRHGSPNGVGRANVCRLDGHVAAERRTAAGGSGVFAAAQVESGTGWFGESDDNAEFDYR